MIGVFDSGIGGSALVREIFRVLPQYKVIYFGDTAHLPYGTKSKETIMRLTRNAADFLLSKGAKIIVIACNTASTVAGEFIKREFRTVPIFEVVEPAITIALQKTQNGRVGIIGTPATVSSGIFQEKIREFKPRTRVFAAACPLFVPLVEEGFERRPETKDIIRFYLDPLKKEKIDTLILACTHYLLLEKTIRDVMGERVNLINPAFFTIQEIKKFLKENPEVERRLEKSKNHDFYVSDRPYKFEELTRRFLGRKIGVKLVSLLEYN